MTRTAKVEDEETLRVVTVPRPDGAEPAHDAARDDPAPAERAAAARRGGRAYVLGLVGVLVLVAAVWFGHQWWTVGRFVELTEDAYLQSDIVSLSVQVDGTVDEIAVVDNARVAAGDTILTLDAAPYRAALAAAQADVAVAEAALGNIIEEQRLQTTKIAAAEADVENADAQLDFARSTHERAQSLMSSGTGTQVALDDATAGLNAATAAAARARAALDLEEGQVPILSSERKQREAALERARAAERIAQIDLEHTVVTAPRAGIVGNRGTAPGEYLRPGTRFMSLVPTDDTYITANFKETQIEHFRPGMAAEVEVDMLGGRVLHGTIDSIAAASGSEFSVLPPDNATGNFTKIVQRIPVRIRIEGDDLPVLRSGASVIVSVNTRDAVEGAAS